MRRALLPPKILFEYCWQAVYPRGPIRSHRRIVAHFSPLPTGEGFSLASTKIPGSSAKSLKTICPVGLQEDERLTQRQREVPQLLPEGKVMKEVGAILNMAPRGEKPTPPSV